jgi:CheY-like chemotaxis protein
MSHQNLHEHFEKQADGKVLLMDDDRYFTLIITEVLRDIGYDVVVAKDGWAALGTYRTHMENGKPFHAVILDIKIKNGIGAGLTLPKLLEIDPGVKAVVSSGNHEDPLMKDYKKFGFKAALPKPYSPYEALLAISKAMTST